MQLTKPQVPAPTTIPAVTDWKGVSINFRHIDAMWGDLVRYLQSYLVKVYNAITPLQFANTTIVNGQSPYTVVTTDEFIAASAGAGADTVVDLPAAVGSIQGTSRALIIIKMDANAHNVAVTPAGADTINGVAAAVNLASQYDVVRLVDAAAGMWVKW